jgi:hypothetical protein
MPNITEGLEGPGVPNDAGDPNTTAGFTAHLAAARDRGRAEQADTSVDVEAEVHASRERIHAQLLAPDDRALAFTIDGDQQKTGAQLRDEALASLEELKRSDPGFRELERRQSEHGAQLAQTAGDVTELRVRQITDALEEGDGAEAIAIGARLARENPAAYRALQEQWMDSEIDFFHEAGYEDFDEAEGDAYRFDQEVQALIDRTDAAAKLEHSSAMISGITNRNAQKFINTLAEAGVTADDSEGVEYYSALSDWVEASTGIAPGELAYSDPDAAYELIAKADAQLNAWQSQADQHRIREEIGGAETKDVAAGLTSSADTQAALLAEQNQLMRMQLGLEREDVPRLPTFDPDAPLPATQSGQAMTVGQLRRALVATDSKDIKSGLTAGKRSLAEVQAEMAVEYRERELRKKQAWLRSNLGAIGWTGS